MSGSPVGDPLGRAAVREIVERADALELLSGSSKVALLAARMPIWFAKRHREPPMSRSAY
jgi:hypothetical protein